MKKTNFLSKIMSHRRAFGLSGLSLRLQFNDTPRRVAVVWCADALVDHESVWMFLPSPRAGHHVRGFFLGEGSRATEVAE